jgi:hypothetical protein
VVKESHGIKLNGAGIFVGNGVRARSAQRTGISKRESFELADRAEAVYK